MCGTPAKKTTPNLNVTIGGRHQEIRDGSCAAAPVPRILRVGVPPGNRPARAGVATGSPGPGIDLVARWHVEC